MTAGEIRQQLLTVKDNTEIFVCNDVDPALLWRMPWVYILPNSLSKQTLKSQYMLRLHDTTHESTNVDVLD